MKNIFYGFVALFFMSNMAIAQLMSDQAHRNMMDTYSANLNGILAPIAAQQGLTLDQLKKNIINGLPLPSSAQDQILAAADSLKTYGARFALANELDTPTPNYEYFYAAFTQAAYDYYYQPDSIIHYIARPHRNTANRAQLKISLFPSATRSVTLPQFNAFGILPTIYIRDLGSSSERIYGTTIHELTHAAHHDMPYSNFLKLEYEAYTSYAALLSLATGNMSSIQRGCGKIMESWATCVEIVLTNDRYIKRLGDTGYKYNGVPFDNYQKQYLDFNYKDDKNEFYTSALYDLNDTLNQWTVGETKLPNDNVSGFTLKEIQDIVLLSNSWDEFKANCKAKHPDINPAEIDVLLNFWN